MESQILKGFEFVKETKSILRVSFLVWVDTLKGVVYVACKYHVYIGGGIQLNGHKLEQTRRVSRFLSMSSL